MLVGLGEIPAQGDQHPVQRLIGRYSRNLESRALGSGSSLATDRNDDGTRPGQARSCDQAAENRARIVISTVDACGLQRRARSRGMTAGAIRSRGMTVSL